MNRQTFTGAVVTTTLLLTPSAAVAEVMDKVSTPWEADRLVPLAIVTGLCALCARRSGWARTPVALVLAVAWAAAGFIFDDLHDPYVGAAIRSELSSLELQAYRVLAPVEALIPLTVSALVARGGGWVKRSGKWTPRCSRTRS
jgi:hypothetical protein